MGYPLASSRSAPTSASTPSGSGKAGLLAPHLRRASGFREYSELDLKQLRFIRRGRDLGFSLEDIGELLAIRRWQEPTASLVQQTLRVIDRRIDELKRWRGCLIEFLGESATPTAAPGSILDCFTDETEGSKAVALAARPMQQSAREPGEHS